MYYQSRAGEFFLENEERKIRKTSCILTLLCVSEDAGEAKPVIQNKAIIDVELCKKLLKMKNKY